MEKRFGEDVYARATQDEINGLLQKTLKESSLTPVSSMEMDNHDAFARDTEFKCNVTFDVLPEIEFPNYEASKSISQGRRVRRRRERNH